jgi:monoamine oxidase
MVEGERVVLAVPFWRLHQIDTIPPLSDKKWQAVSSLLRGQYTVVHLLVPKEAQKLWLHEEENPFAIMTDGPLGVIYGTAGEPPAASSALVFSLLVHGQAAAAFHMVPREVRYQEIYAHLDRLWPGLAAMVQTTYSYTYHPAALPVWPPGRSPLDALAQELREPELGLYLAGDYLYNAHSDGAARSGIQAAERIGQELGRTLSRPTAPPARLPLGPRPAHRRGS